MLDYQTLCEIKKLDRLLKSFSMLLNEDELAFFLSHENSEMPEETRFELIGMLFGNPLPVSAIYN
jgi:hypothetical protein